MEHRVGGFWWSMMEPEKGLRRKCAKERGREVWPGEAGESRADWLLAGEGTAKEQRSALHRSSCYFVSWNPSLPLGIPMYQTAPSWRQAECLSSSTTLPPLSLSIKQTGLLWWIKQLSVWGRPSPPRGCFRSGCHLGLGLSWYQARTGRQREVCTVGTRYEGRTGDLLALITCGLDGEW